MFFCEWYSFRKSNDDASEHVPKLSMSLRKNSYKLNTIHASRTRTKNLNHRKSNLASIASLIGGNSKKSC